MIFGFVFDQCLQRKPTKHQTLQGNLPQVPHCKETVMIKHLYTKKVHWNMSLWGHLIKLERYREDWHGSYARMTRINREMVQIIFAFFALDLATQFYQNTLRINHFPTNNPVLNNVAFRSDCQTPLSLSLSSEALPPKLRSLFSGTNLSRSLSCFLCLVTRKP